MKKGLLAIVLSVALLACAFLPAYAAEEKIPYGKAEVTLTLADSLEALTLGTATFGSFAGEDGALVVTSSDIADNYDVMLAESPENQAAYTGKQYVVLDVVNNSDGNIWFCMMPSVAGSPHLFLRSDDPTPTVLVDSSGGMQEAEWTDGPTLSFRYGFLVPEAFEGYICIPFSSFCEINEWDTPYLTEAKPLTQMGIHIERDLGAYIELVVNGLYTTGALPEYEEETPVAPTEVPATDVPATEVPATDAPTQTPPSATEPAGATEPSQQQTAGAGTPTAAGNTKAPNQNNADSDKTSGKTGVIVVVCVIAAVVVIAVAAILIVLRKKKKRS